MEDISWCCCKGSSIFERRREAGRQIVNRDYERSREAERGGKDRLVLPQGQKTGREERGLIETGVDSKKWVERGRAKNENRKKEGKKKAGYEMLAGTEVKDGDITIRLHKRWSSHWSGQYVTNQFNCCDQNTNPWDNSSKIKDQHQCVKKSIEEGQLHVGRGWQGCGGEKEAATEESSVQWLKAKLQQVSKRQTEQLASLYMSHVAANSNTEKLNQSLAQVHFTVCLYREHAPHRCSPPQSVVDCCHWLQSWLCSWTGPRPPSAPSLRAYLQDTHPKWQSTIKSVCENSIKMSGTKYNKDDMTGSC